MKKYFWTDGQKQYGPFTIDELKREGLSRQTMVWTESMADWKPAIDVEELQQLFASTPPPLMSEPDDADYPVSMDDDYLPENRPKNWLVESILVTLLCCLPFGIVGIINAAQVDTKFKQGDFEGAERASREAAKWTRIGFFIGIGLVVLYIIYFVVMLAAGLSGGF